MHSAFGPWASFCHGLSFHASWKSCSVFRNFISGELSVPSQLPIVLSEQICSGSSSTLSRRQGFSKLSAKQASKTNQHHDHYKPICPHPLLLDDYCTFDTSYSFMVLGVDALSMVGGDSSWGFPSPTFLYCLIN